MKEKIEKSKATALGLAILLAFWTWAYSYKYDNWKFWMGLVFNVFLFWTIVIPIAIWIWAILDVALKSEGYYKDYFE